MSEINTERKGKGKKGKPKKMSTRVDLTPMVDLGFLLITFFLLATTMIKPQTMELAMPSKEKPKPGAEVPIKQSRAVTIVLGKDNKVFYWTGMVDGGKKPAVVETDYSSKGIRKYLIERNFSVMTKMKELDKEKELKHLPDSTYKKRKLDILKEKDVANKISPIVIIKPSDESTYKNMIDILDEMAICNVGVSTIVDITPEDLDMIKNATK